MNVNGDGSAARWAFSHSSHLIKAGSSCSHVLKRTGSMTMLGGTRGRERAASKTAADRRRYPSTWSSDGTSSGFLRGFYLRKRRFSSLLSPGASSLVRSQLTHTATSSHLSSPHTGAHRLCPTLGARGILQMLTQHASCLARGRRYFGYV